MQLKINAISILIILGLTCFQCDKENKYPGISDINKKTYYTSEIIPTEHLDIYGSWKLIKVNGGFAGSGHELHFDQLEIKPYGIYGIIKGNSLSELGKIELDIWDSNQTEKLQLKFMPDMRENENYMYLYPEQKLAQIRNRDTLDLISPCCDMYNYHFKRIE